MDKKHTVIFICILVAVASVLTWFVTFQVIAHSQKSTELRLSEEKYDTLSQFLDLADLQDIIDNYYYKDINKQQLTDGALKGMVNALEDPYSTYYTESEYKDFTQMSDGLYVGIGITFLKEQNTRTFVVVKVAENSPAAEAGIEPGDVIVSINGKSVYDMSAQEAADVIEGPTGSTVRLELMGEDGFINEVSLKRAEVQKDLVTYTMYDDICNIIISEFHGDVSAEFEKALEFAEKQDAIGIVIDLRGNLGGSVSECVEVADQILPEGIVVYTEDKEGNKTVYKSDANYNEMPLVVLVDSMSASSSEIFAGAVQDFGRGPIIGSNTYGKGVVQTIYDMPYSGGAVKLTSAAYFTPSGRKINEDGITPDIQVSLPDDVLSGDVPFSFDTDTQLQEGIKYLHEHVATESEEALNE